VAKGYPDYYRSIIFTEQWREIETTRDWFTRLGLYKDFLVTVTLDVGESGAWTFYTVPAGKVLYVSDVVFCSEVKVLCRLAVDAIAKYYDRLSAWSTSKWFLSRPMRFLEGDELSFWTTNYDTVAGEINHQVMAWETGASSPGSSSTSELLKLKTSEAYKRGFFNTAIISINREGIMSITFRRFYERKWYSFKAFKLYDRKERILEDEICYVKV